MTVAWVIGGSGLLGSALCRRLLNAGTSLYHSERRIPWEHGAEVLAQIRHLIHSFEERARAAGGWEIYWAAGIGTMSTPASELVLETDALTTLLRLIGESTALTQIPGALALSSSAGAIYAGSSEMLIDESSEPAPTTDYAHTKLHQESILRQFTTSHRGLRALIARISTIYGPGQSTGRRRGLIAHIAQCLVRNRPVHIYVPLETTRDYIDADDAASMIIDELRSIGTSESQRLRIVASGLPASVAEVVSIFKKLARRSPMIVTSASASSRLYAKHVRYRSVSRSKATAAKQTSLLVGIGRVIAAERLALARGSASRAPDPI